MQLHSFLCVTLTEIKCDVPVIEQGHVIGSPREYRENEVLNFACEDGYKKTDERSPRCIKVGGKADWSPTPGCRCKYAVKKNFHIVPIFVDTVP